MSDAEDDHDEGSELFDLDDDAATIERSNGDSTASEGAGEQGAEVAEAAPPGVDMKMTVTGEYDPIHRQKGFSMYVPPGQYNPKRRRMDVAEEGGWKYDPTKTFGRWHCSYIPERVTQQGSSSALAEELKAAQVVGGDLPLSIHDSLLQLRTQLLEGDSMEAIGTGGAAGQEDAGKITDYQLLESTRIAVTAPGASERGKGTTGYYTIAANVPVAPKRALCIGSNTQLTVGKVNARTQGQRIQRNAHAGLPPSTARPFTAPRPPPAAERPVSAEASAGMSAFKARLAQLSTSLK